ncbi:MAG TPA: sulfotransferase domain-containing protein [Candidatus Sulfotelmatobacter sp.]|nr:sulfotransferase domain-containing protein [Candidatus Sulfotelmatobacter sp.]
MPLFTALSEAVRVLTGRKNAGRGLTVFPDDIFLVSYPRSGNTWTRFLIGNLIYDDPVTFTNVDARIPEIYLFPDRVLRRLPRARVLKSHECFDPRYKRAIYIVRDPRDVAVSYYHYVIKRKLVPEGYPVGDFVPRFMAAEFDIQWKWAANWQDHVLSWYALREGVPGFLFLRYEDMLADAVAELEKVAAFLGRDVNAARIRKAVELSSADHMRNLEKTQGQAWRLTESTRQDKPFVRAAKANTWQGVLSASAVAEIESAWGGTMQRLGYALSHTNVNPAALTPAT